MHARMNRALRTDDLLIERVTVQARKELIIKLEASKEQIGAFLSSLSGPAAALLHRTPHAAAMRFPQLHAFRG